MRNILSRDNREVLEQFARSNVLLAFDYDGTLAPIVAVPAKAKMRTTTCALLEKVARLYPCIVISGRARRDVIERLGSGRALGVIGNHGVEPWQLHDRFRDAVAGWYPVLEKRLGHVKGVVVENKTYSLSIHYRRSREKKKARAAILRAVSMFDNARIIGGEQVVNILPGGAPHKGIALDQERVRLHCDTAVYIGDDETDEDVFVLDRPGRLLTIRVGAKRASKAAYCIRNQHQIDEFLETMLALRHGRCGVDGRAHENC